MSKAVLIEALRRHAPFAMLLEQYNVIDWEYEIGTHLDVSVDPGTYEHIIYPEVGYAWLLGWIRITTSANTTADVYIKQGTASRCVYTKILSVPKGSSREKLFVVERHSTLLKMTSLKIVFTNSATTSETQRVELVATEIEIPYALLSSPAPATRWIWTNVIVGTGKTIADPIRPRIVDLIRNTPFSLIWYKLQECVIALPDAIDASDEAAINAEVRAGRCKWMSDDEVDEWMTSKLSVGLHVARQRIRIPSAAPRIFEHAHPAGLVLKGVLGEQSVEYQGVRFGYEVRRIA